MSQIKQLPRASLAWLLLALVAVVVPHVRHLPIWETIAISVVILWRVQLHRGVWYLPGRWSKLLLALLAVVGLKLHYGSLFSLEPMVGLLVISVMLKLLEMYRGRDALIVVMLGFFVSATQFLFSQSVFDFLYGIFCFVLLVCTLVALTSGDNPKSVNKTLPLATKLTLQCIPVMVLLFLFLPRFGNLWAVPLPQSSARTGISDFMSPGDITNLSRDGGRAFTATFEGEVPANKELYWRGIVLSYFDGRSWMPSAWGEYPIGTSIDWVDREVEPWRASAKTFSEPIDYTVIMEATNQRWLFSLPLADVTTKGTGITREFTAVTLKPVTKKTQYSFRSSLSYQIDASPLSDIERRRYTRLPSDKNPITISKARLWAEQTATPQTLIDRFLQMVRRDYTYTLQPPALGEHSVDEFLWQSKQGFCEHFASSFVVFMRAAKIPARVVTGYQGGEWRENFLQVSQSDAHAWAEVWMQGKGWVRVDPTAYVAPDRIELGIRSVFEQPVDNPLSLEAYRNIDLLNRLRLQLDLWNYNWQRWVLNYDQSQQKSLLAKLIGNINWLNAGVVLLLSVASVLGCIALYLWVTNKPVRPAEEVVLFNRFLKKCKSNGHQKKNSETARVFVERIIRVYPLKREPLVRILTLFEAITYENNKALMTDLRTEVNAFYLPK